MGFIRKAVQVTRTVAREVSNADMKGGGSSRCQGCGKPISGKRTVCSNKCAEFYSVAKWGDEDY